MPALRGCLALVCLLISGAVLCQQNIPVNAPLVIKQLPKEGIVLDKGWKFEAGDNPAYANVTYDDSNWQGINPTVGIRKQPEVAKSGICWLRLKFSLSSNLQKEQFALVVRQYIASEIYLNGRLLYRFGLISSVPGETVAYNPAESLPVALPANLIGDQVLAVRYKVQPDLDFSSGEPLSFPLIAITILTTNDAFKLVKINERHLPVTNTFRIGAYCILAVLYLAFFLYNPSHKAYLFFFLFAVLGIPVDILQFNYPAEVQKTLLLSRVFSVLWELAQLFLLTAVYLLLDLKKGWVYWTLLIFSVVGMVLNSRTFNELIMLNLINLELARCCFKTLKRKTRGAWILTSGAVCFLVLMGAFCIGVYFNLGYYSIPLGDSYVIADILYGIALLSIPIATTTYVALEFGFTSHALKEKLTEVEELSRKTIAQEQEKQQILASQKETLEKQVAEQTGELKQSLEELKATQQQLIQHEKMASLGELTAGIAHEIQNPLNFVNNFSDVNAELLEEMKAEMLSDNKAEAVQLADDIIANETLIKHHGRRADAIVKGMLQHARSTSGEKEPTDLNALVEQYLQLAYHGYRAKDKSFSTDLSTHYDSTIDRVNLVPQEIGRVLLNLFNNAFYAVNERKKQLNGSFDLVVSVSTKKEGDHVFITVKDNGTGMSEKVAEKVFQPFFTTKPTGEGTGLGLSLSYDIVTKGHGGTMSVQSTEGKGSAFIVLLPAQDKA